MAHSGLVLATSIATLLLLYGLKKKIGSLGTKGYIITFVKTGLASGIMVYLVLCYLFGVEEVRMVVGKVREINSFTREIQEVIL